jgi:hypothetical protein
VPKDWRKQGYFEALEVFETGLRHANPNKYGLKSPVSRKMWYVPHLKERFIGDMVLNTIGRIPNEVRGKRFLVTEQW